MEINRSLPPSRRLERFWIVYATIGLFCFFALRFCLNAQGKPFWADEVDGIFGALDYGWKNLLLIGAPQMSRSPLSYLFDRGMLAIWGDRPQLDWDLRIYLRIAPAVAWSLASAAIFPFTLDFLNRVAGQHRLFARASIALGASVFFYENSFMNIYAIETRAYSLWVSLSTLQFCLWWFALDRPATARNRIALLLVTTLMCFTTYAAIGQAVIMLAIDLWLRLRDPKIRAPGRRDWGWAAAIFAASCAVTFFYFQNAGKYGYPSSPFSLYFESVLEVMLKSFHHHGVQPAFVTFPLFFLAIPLWRWREPRVRAGAVFAWLSLLLSCALFIASMLKGGIYASRYAIFLIPSLTWIYFLGITTLAMALIRGLSRVPQLALAKPRLERGLIPLLTLIALIEATGGLMKFTKEIRAGWELAEARNAYGRAKNRELCSAPLVHQQEYVHYETPERLVKEFEALNEECRRL